MPGSLYLNLYTRIAPTLFFLTTVRSDGLIVVVVLADLNSDRDTNSSIEVGKVQENMPLQGFCKIVDSGCLSNDWPNRFMLSGRNLSGRNIAGPIRSSH
jgi:hypothetical protein